MKGLAHLTFALFVAQPLVGRIKVHPDLMATLHHALFAAEYPHLSALLDTPQ